MAKIVIAGSADCPYYAKSELLADALVKNLPNFKLHKIVKQPHDWERWLSDTCTRRGWQHQKSPLVWRELVDRGGKGLLIGGANEFQEYAYGYYGVKSSFTSNDMTKIGSENLQNKVDIDEEERQFRAQVKPVVVCVTSASSPVSYSMMEALAKGEGLGPKTEISLRLVDTEDNLDSLEGLRMEVMDLACPLLRGVTVTTDIVEALSDCSVVILLDEIVKEEEQSKEDWLKKNREHFLKYAGYINEKAKSDIKVILGGRGPVNFIAYMMLEQMPNFPPQNIVAMSRVVENHAKSIIADRLKVNSACVVDVVVWGHSSEKYFLDTNKSRVHNYDGAIWGPPSFSLPVGEMVHDDKWLQGELLENLAKRQEMVESALNHRASASHAAAVVSLLSHWWCGSPSGQMFSLGVQSEGWYDVPEGMVFSYPVTFNSDGSWSVVKNMELTDESKEKLQETVKDLLSEKEAIYPPPHVPTPTPPPEPEPTPTPPGEENTNNSNTGADGELVDGEGLTLERITEDQEGEARAADAIVTSPRSGPGSPHSETQEQAVPAAV